MMEIETNSKTPFYLKASAILVGIISMCYILSIGQSIIVPMLFALFIAILTNPVVNFLVRKKINRIVAIFISVFAVLLILVGLIYFISLQISMFTETFPQFREKFTVVLRDVTLWASQTFNMDVSVINNWVNDMRSNAVSNISGSAGQALVTAGSSIVAVIVIPVYIFLILYYKSLLLNFVAMLFESKHHKTVTSVLESTNTIIRSYLNGLLTEGAIVAVLNSVALLALGVDYAILLGITGALLNLIPYIGGVVAVAMPMLVAFVTKSPLTALLVLVFYLVIQFIDNHFLVPYIVASKVKINALMAIVVVLLGNMLWGVSGMFLSIPLTALVKVICDHIDSLKPWGFLLGDDIPVSQKLLIFKKRK